MDPMLAIPRPTVRAECARGMEARPCPWVSCRHHLLLEIAGSSSTKDPRATSIRLNTAGRGRNALGRRRGLEASSAALIVRAWIDDAVELISRLRYTCALDVAEDYPDGITGASIGWLLGVTDKAIAQEMGQATQRMNALREFTE
jgi:hypothetical protein